jgi:Fe-Mn family superoxide dismutase
MRFELAELPYKQNALEPYISKKTMELHYYKHYHAYLSSLNNLVKGSRLINLDLETIIRVADGPVFNMASLVWNHAFYFESLKPADDNTLKGSFAEAIDENYGSLSFFKTTFLKAVESFFGVGWIWVVLNQNGEIEIIQKSDAGNPMRIGLIPLMGIDVWEHAYYLDYQQKCLDYAKAYWQLINWEVVGKRYQNALL